MSCVGVFLWATSFSGLCLIVVTKQLRLCSDSFFLENRLDFNIPTMFRFSTAAPTSPVSSPGYWTPFQHGLGLVVSFDRCHVRFADGDYDPVW